MWTTRDLDTAWIRPTATGNLYVSTGNDRVDLRNAVATTVSGVCGGSNTGNDIYLFGVGAGQDTISDIDTTVGNSDTILLVRGLPNLAARAGPLPVRSQYWE